MGEHDVSTQTEQVRVSGLFGAAPLQLQCSLSEGEKPPMPFSTNTAVPVIGSSGIDRPVIAFDFNLHRRKIRSIYSFVV
jgi:hypothetical protein